MIILGLAGAAGSGKDTVADYLVKTFGFVKFAFSDALYREVQEAYNLPDQELLRNRDTKERPTERLSLINCGSDEFIGVAIRTILHESRHLHLLPVSPRQVLQLWGTEYRRAQDADYWVKRTAEFIFGLRDMFQYPEHAPQYFVEVGTRFENEREWIKLNGGGIWHINRDCLNVSDSHASAQPLPPLTGERELWNNDTIERLHRGIDLLMTTQTRFVRVEPMLPVEEPKEE